MSSSPIGLAAGQLTRLNHLAAEPADAPPRDLLEALGRVPDPRDRRGIRYTVAAVLAVAVCATLAGARSYAAIGEWAADGPARLRAGLGLRRGAVLDLDLATIWRVLTSVDPAALGAWVRSRLAAARKARRRVVFAVDGKTLRGARPRGGTAPHLMACLDHATGTVLAQIAVGEKTNEITMLAGLLDQIPDLKDVIISMDALHAQREHAAYLRNSLPGNRQAWCTLLPSFSWVCRTVQAGRVLPGFAASSRSR